MKLSTAIVLLFLSTSLHAASISLIGEDLSLSPGETGSILIGIFSNDPDSPKEENLTGWQLALQIIPDEGSEGILELITAELPEDNYILEGINFGLVLSITSNSVFAIDLNSPFSEGIQVPTEPAGLLNLTFLTSKDASGSFGLFAESFSEWTDNGTISLLGPKLGGSAPVQPRQFLNLKGVESIRLGTITANVPEPASATGTLFFVIIFLTSRKRSPLQRGQKRRA